MYLIPQTIETKNNYLFFGNVTESAYDVTYDARAYRYSIIDGTDQYAKLYYSSGVTVKYDVVTDGAANIPVDADCANKYNILDYDTYTGTGLAPRTWDEDAKYQSNGTTLGGEGLNISYEFITDTVDTGTPKYSNQPYLNPEDYKYVGYQRDEIYRFGIRLFNTYGEGTFVKWIGDIRFPSVEESPIYNTSTGNINILGIQFTVDNLPPGVTGYQILRANRNTGDQTVVDTGYIGHLQLGDSDDGYFFGGTYNSFTDVKDTNKYARPKLWAGASDNPPYQSIVEYISPETVYNNISSTNYNRIDSYKGILDASWLRTSGTIPFDKDEGGDNFSLSYLTQYSVGGSTTPIVKKIKTIDCFKYQGVRDDDHTIIMGGRFGAVKLNSKSNNPLDPFQNAMGGAGTLKNRGVKGTTLLLKLSADLTTDASAGYVDYPAYTLRRKHIKPYGGFTYGAIQATEYIPCSSVQDYTSSSVDVWGGDTFITWYDY
ncbi:MAG TPA: hypothetical protein PLG47_05950, partial [Candidatus Dojkabacteria bacterium]|nr:hypothetical protein [Candidatus Dojkabacteria bacterium]